MQHLSALPHCYSSMTMLWPSMHCPLCIFPGAMASTLPGRPAEVPQRSMRKLLSTVCCSAASHTRQSWCPFALLNIIQNPKELWLCGPYLFLFPILATTSEKFVTHESSQHTLHPPWEPRRITPPAGSGPLHRALVRLCEHQGKRHASIVRKAVLILWLPQGGLRDL